MILDVGCGVDPKGDVNVDLYIGEVSPDIHVFLDQRKIPNGIKASCYNLPFKSAIFDKVYSRALLEHLDSPLRALREMIRVAKKDIELSVPHRYFRHNIWRPPARHKQFFNTRTMLKMLRSLNLPFNIKIEHRDIPSNFFPLFRIPSMFHIQIRKPKD